MHARAVVLMSVPIAKRESIPLSGRRLAQLHHGQVRRPVALRRRDSITCESVSRESYVLPTR